MSENQSCASCCFAGWTGTQLRACRRHAPVVSGTLVRGELAEAKWPLVETYHWCGDYEPVPRAEGRNL
jgi:hypothetical protein